jgi:uncharacterized membrane protein YphA (DoxX/SURF4 family)
MKKLYLGRHVFGLAGILFGVITLAWRDFNIWQQIQPLGNVPHRTVLACFVAVLEIFGGVAIQFRKTARIGALTLGGIYLAFALLYVPRILAEPRIYTRYGGFFEEFSQVAGALIIYSMFAQRSERSAKLARLGYVFFRLSVISFTLEQIFYLSATAEFVPKWIPPGQMFWAVATTIAFALAAVALLTGRSALLASQLLTLMIVGFGLLIWLPAPFADPHQLTSWAGNAQNLSIAAAAWIVTDFLCQRASTWSLSHAAIDPLANGV